uniref:Uncharacterized protein n=1 Tax=Arundo donax TaxID=35708 RepID=A0A0A8Y549_ARUDO
MVETSWWLLFVLDGPNWSMISTFSRPRRIRGQLGWRCWSHHPRGTRLSIWSTRLTW